MVLQIYRFGLIYKLTLGLLAGFKGKRNKQFILIIKSLLPGNYY